MLMAKIKHQDIVNEVLQLAEYAENLVYVQDVDCIFLHRDEKYYAPLSLLEIRQIVYEHVSTFHQSDVNITGALVNDIAAQLFLAVPRIKSMSMESNSHLIVFDDGMLNTNTFEFLPTQKEKYPSLYIPHAYADIQQSRAPTFDTFLASSLVMEDTHETDRALITYIQEIMGYMLLGGINTSEAFFFVGGGSNGKSVLASVIQSMFLPEYVSSMSIETLTTDKFSLSALVGKRLNICNEDESKYIRSDKFKAIVSGDMVSAERKYGGRFDFYPQAKFLFCSNRMPSFDGLNYGLRRRMKIIPFHKRFTEANKNIHLLRTLKKEMPGIIRWSLEGAQRLLDNKMVFSQDSVSLKNAIKVFEESTSSAVLFFNETYIADMNEDKEARAFVTNAYLYDDYKAWCVTNGRKAMNNQNFHSDIKTNIEVEKDLKKIDGKTHRVYYARRNDIDIMRPDVPF